MTKQMSLDEKTDDMDDKMDDKSCRKVAHKYYCEKCDYSTSKLSSWKKHIDTKKHNGLQMTTKSAEKLPKSCYKCECGKKYKHASSLWNHKNKCNFLVWEEINESKQIDKKDKI